jgi:hypothetical protein
MTPEEFVSMTRAIHGHGRSGADRRLWAAVAAFALIASAAPAADETLSLYQWTDSNGVIRYTPDFDRIPSSARHTVVTIQPGASPPPTTPVYFEPDPREPAVAVPGQPPEATSGSATPATPPAAATTTGTPGGDAQRIRELEARIAADEEALKQLISAPGEEADVTVSPELREIAARLPRLQAELASLRQRPTGSNGP